MNELRAIIAAFRQELKMTGSIASMLTVLFSNGARSAVLSWIAYKNGDSATLTYLYVGMPLMAIWWGVVFRLGGSLNNELMGRTLDFTLISRTSVIVMLIGKTLAEITYAIPSGIIALVAVFLVSHELPMVADIGILPFSLLLVMFGLAVSCLLFAPLMVLVGGRGGFFNAIMPFGALISGFILPVNRLPLALEVIARAFPGSWAMESIWQSILGPESWWIVIRGWLMCILMSIVWFSVTWMMCKAVEKRIRITGSIGTY